MMMMMIMIMMTRSYHDADSDNVDTYIYAFANMHYICILNLLFGHILDSGQCLLLLYRRRKI